MRTFAYTPGRSETETYLTDWKSAAKIGFFAGCIFLFVTAANPWGLSALIVPTVMGREILAPAKHHFSSGLILVHLGLATVFSLLMAPVLQRLRILGAILVAYTCRIIRTGENPPLGPIGLGSAGPYWLVLGVY